MLLACWESIAEHTAVLLQEGCHRAFPAWPWASHCFLVSVLHLQNGDIWNGKSDNKFLLKPSVSAVLFNGIPQHNALENILLQFYRLETQSVEAKSRPAWLLADLLMLALAGPSTSVWQRSGLKLHTPSVTLSQALHCTSSELLAADNHFINTSVAAKYFSMCGNLQ